MRHLFVISLFVFGLAATPHRVAGADVRMYIRHEVGDYTTWRKTYDAFDATRKKLGVTGQAVYRSVDNPNDVTVTHDFRSADKAKAFEASSDLKAAMDKAGVKGTPQIWITNRAAE